MINILSEVAGDASAIREVTEAAFRSAEHSDAGGAVIEADIVDTLREDGALTISLVADDHSDIVGHAAVSPVTIEGAKDWYGLGPVSVHPDRQGEGIGQRLVNEALETLKDAHEANGVVVLGDPNYYSRFGFEVIDGLTYPGAPVEYFQAINFRGQAPKGEVSYHKAFGE